ncbi:unnamed protein product [marine sediment metagenome]|uniref:Uncharacterized protein n=1 Tax=marine sediment metagenome TaxID=412755 RepID=X1BX46_9ZZZZ
MKKIKRKAEEQANKVIDDRESELWKAAYNNAIMASGDPALMYLGSLGLFSLVGSCEGMLER